MAVAHDLDRLIIRVQRTASTSTGGPGEVQQPSRKLWTAFRKHKGAHFSVPNHGKAGPNDFQESEVVPGSAGVRSPRRRPRAGRRHRGADPALDPAARRGGG